ncbi:hypothetical protein P5P86_10740 [Nocardioides sp. BP30]|uniref:hypothetical protein n=1 Tax=Nocardioides sp. BP30 TaxID=3036374 RepID=UPI00246872F2|nr:hypothetical protein [Nocardioides sp. BP30]WGL50444.1 hypothetical protein P5P86_10740 [Nocardioides sp. BP30]
MSLLAVLRTWKVPTAAFAVVVTVTLSCLLGGSRVSLPGVRGGIAVVQFVPFALSACVAGTWVNAFAFLEERGMRSPAAVRAVRGSLSLGLAALGAVAISGLRAAPPESLALSLACLAAGIGTVRRSAIASWALPLCINYAYYAARIDDGGTRAALVASSMLIVLAVAVYAWAPQTLTAG